ncbi:hypothetical protein [Amycolatopsis albispora]|uniref:Uncharacterized protein n=1 Tax=Amycolatopsis albispora TaxID=1804986 RepID=A0A344L2T4_9PSEU|nr:hypothetical protein [Amycolatopsis albispora]AXB42358.1 hypothetical protein A4R43_07315 [Amycolatopsis albispora]
MKRQARIAEASPSIPDAVFWFMALTLALTIGGFAYSIPVKRNLFHLAAVVTTAALFIGSLLVINDVDEPFSGAIAVDSAAIHDTAADLADDYAAVYGPGQLPCDETGKPV